MFCNFSLQVIIANCKNLVRQCSVNSLHFHFKRILHISKPKTNAGDSAQVPVDYCAVRYVKKPAGAKPGMVIFTNQHTLYVKPEQR